MALRPEEADVRSELLIRDAEEALQRERLQQFWKAWGSTLIGMAVMLVVGTGVGVAWREWRQSDNEKSTAVLLDVVSDSTTPMSDELARDMSGNHAAIAWLSQVDAAKPGTLADLYENAARSGDDTVWGWLARWNTLRLRMDNPAEDSKKLIGDYEDLANDMKGSPLSALAWADAAIIAGEREKDPATALEYLARAEKITPRATPMWTIVADLKHLYEIRAQSSDAVKEPTP